MHVLQRIDSSVYESEVHMTFDNSFELKSIHSDVCSNVTLTLERLRLHIIAMVVGHTLNVLALVASANYKQKTKCNYC